MTKRRHAHIDNWEEDTPIEMAPVRDMASLRNEVLQLRRSIRTMWFLSIVVLCGLLLSIILLFIRSRGVTPQELDERLKIEQLTKIERILHILETK